MSAFLRIGGGILRSWISFAITGVMRVFEGSFLENVFERGTAGYWRGFSKTGIKRSRSAVRAAIAGHGCVETNTLDPQLRQKLIAAIKKHTDALDKNDAAAVAANFTEDGILVTPDGPIFGRESIEKYYVGLFKQIQ
jgi:hypothetical protein